MTVLPSLSCIVDSSWIMPTRASGAAPPNRPEWTALSRVVSVTVKATSPRRPEVMEGSPTLAGPESQMMNASLRTMSGLAATQSSMWLKVSSSPSSSRRTVHGGVPSKAPMVPRIATTPALQSAVPRP